MIAIDTNLLVYAHREDSPHHERARKALRGLAEGPRRWTVPWPCLHEFLAIVTHPRIYRPPSSMELALGAVQDLLAMPGMTPIAETDDHPVTIERLLARGGVVGTKVHDARVAAICLCHGVSELWSADRDFSYFPELVARNPLVS